MNKKIIVIGDDPKYWRIIEETKQSRHVRSMTKEEIQKEIETRKHESKTKSVAKESRRR